VSRTQYFTAASLDGFVADAHESLDWLADPDDPADTTYTDFIRDIGAIAMGSATYEWIAVGGFRLASVRPIGTTMVALHLTRAH